MLNLLYYNDLHGGSFQITWIAPRDSEMGLAAEHTRAPATCQSPMPILDQNSNIFSFSFLPQTLSEIVLIASHLIKRFQPDTKTYNVLCWNIGMVWNSQVTSCQEGLQDANDTPWREIYSSPRIKQQRNGAGQFLYSENSTADQLSVWF